MNLTPLGINRHAAVRHGREVVCMGAGTVNVPALEYIAGRRGWLIVVVSSGIVGSQISAESNVTDLVKLSTTGLLDWVTIAIKICSIHEVDGVHVAGIVAVNGACAAATPCIIWRITELGEAHEVKVVLGFSKETVIGGHLFVKHEILAAISGVGRLSRKRLNIIVNILR